MICILKFTKGHNSVESVGGVTVLIVLTCLIMLYICVKFCQSISKGLELQTRTIGSMPGWSKLLTDIQIENRIPISRHAWGRHDKKETGLWLAFSDQFLCETKLITVVNHWAKILDKGRQVNPF